MTVTLDDVQEALTEWTERIGDNRYASWHNVLSTANNGSLTFHMRVDNKNEDDDIVDEADIQWFEVTIKEVTRA